VIRAGGSGFDKYSNNSNELKTRQHPWTHDALDKSYTAADAARSSTETAKQLLSARDRFCDNMQDYSLGLRLASARYLPHSVETREYKTP
jgi:hypothetical protein